MSVPSHSAPGPTSSMHSPLVTDPAAPGDGANPWELSRILLHAEHLEKAFGRKRVLRDVSFSVSAGTMVGIVGENGTGKSTLLRILAGELRPRRGRVMLDGSMGYCPQAVNLNDALSVGQHLTYFRAAYGLADQDRADALVERLELGPYRKAPVATLSGGTKQKLNLILALMHDPVVLLLDEPYQGFDWETYLRFWELAEELRSRGRAVLVISHLLFDQQRFDALYRLRDGTLVEIVPEVTATGDE
ncbi:MAG TPA: ABC transporter ATP-binding protein [Ktedonobacterales bacterium]